MSNFTAVLDTNVLFGLATRSLLLTMATPLRLYQPYWSSQIMVELERCLGAKRPDVAFGPLQEYMNAALPDASRDPPQYLIDVMPNERNDRHVLALGVMVRAQVIVTNNCRHFPPEHCRRYGIQAVTIDEFVVSQIHLYPDQVVQAVEIVRERIGRRRHMTPVQIIDKLRPQMPDSMAMLTEHIAQR